MPSCSIKIAVLFEDQHLIVLEKEAGLLSQPGLGPTQHDSLLARIRIDWPSAQIVHRLDRDTSGLMVLALDPETHRKLSAQFAQRQVKKIYRAQIDGCPDRRSGTIDAPIRRKSTRPPRYCVDFKNGKGATTHWIVTASHGSMAHITLRPITGRSHQLRVHMEYIGHPILGDPLYGTEQSRGKLSRLGLHAHCLAFRHPSTTKWMQWTSPEPF
ncbi:MAG: RluA family pseudouridine synthase [Planctomycetota bacterium]|nr:RluA family pseudouridine synthase [Planctomycetota bacterium]